MKECSYLTCNRPSDSWKKAKKKWAGKNGEGAGLGRQGKRSFYSLTLTLFNVCFPPPSFRATVHYAWNRLVHSGPESFFHCKWSMDVHLGAFDVLKAHTQAATIPALACVKRHFFFCFPFRCRGKFLAVCFWWWCFIVDRNELKYYLKRSLQSTFIIVIVIHRNVHVYLYIITWRRKLARKKKVF